MSALDQAFLKAYSKDHKPSLSGTAAPAPQGSQQSGNQSLRNQPAVSHEDPYAEGTWYRIEPPEGVEAQVESDELQERPTVAAAKRARRFAARSPHLRFQAPPALPQPAQTRRAARAVPAEPQVVSAMPVEIQKVSSEPSDSIDLESFYTIAIAGPWETLFVPRQERPSAVLTESSPEPTVAQAQAIPLVPPVPTPVLARIDPPAASAVAKPHFALPIVERAEATALALPAPIPDSVLEPISAETAAGPSEPVSIASEPGPKMESVLAPLEVPTPEAAELEPAWEVERFSWPQRCDELLASALDDWGVAVRQLLSNARVGQKTLAVTGLRRDEGRSTLTLCLARLAAQTGARIAVVDADFENPKLADLLGVGTQCDWRMALADGLPLAEAAIVCLADKLTLIPLQQAVPMKQTSFGRPGPVAMLNSARAAFDLVLVDVGPIAGPEHAASWGGKSCPFDGVLLVRDLRHTDAEETAATVAHLRRSGLERIVVLENYARVQESEALTP